jgi:predicted Holliday junction resolvase-like endonuclease
MLEHKKLRLTEQRIFNNIMDITTFVLAFFTLVVGLLIGALVVFLLSQRKINELRQSQKEEIEKARKESVDQSRNTLKGKMAEQMAPLLPGFNFLPADSRFLGDPVDYVVFNGYTNLRDANGSAENVEVIILDIKHNTAALSPSQRAIAKAVEEGRVRFDIVRIFEDGTVKSHTWKSKRGKKTEEVESE